MEKRVNVIVRGLVQGVGFRMFVLREANMRELSGWTRNLPDDTVEIEVQGDSGLVDELLNRVRTGPSRSRVTALAVRETNLVTTETKFRVLG
ncbi:MAG: acylphosphatase [Chlorobiaceae bacterium]|nr:acylphosphatase [Chlorobiaceae bacterium]